MHRININPAKKELYHFGLITGGLTPAIFGLLLPTIFKHGYPIWPWIVGIILIVWAITLPRYLKPLYIVWMTIGYYLGWLNTRIILTFIFYFIIFPLGLIMRIIGKDPMNRSFRKEQKSYRVTSSVPEKKDFENPY